MFRFSNPVFVSKALSMVVCVVFIIAGRYPPAHAQDVQQQPASVYAVAIEASSQGRDLVAMQKQLEDQKVAIALLSAKVDNNSNDISVFHGEAVGVAALLVLLQIIQMVFASKKKVGA